MLTGQRNTNKETSRTWNGYI